MKMEKEKKCGMCGCTESSQWIKRYGTYTCGACMQEIKDMIDYDTQNCW